MCECDGSICGMKTPKSVSCSGKWKRNYKRAKTSKEREIGNRRQGNVDGVQFFTVKFMSGRKKKAKVEVKVKRCVFSRRPQVDSLIFVCS